MDTIKEEILRDLRTIRVRLETPSQFPPSREKSLGLTKVDEAIMWLERAKEQS